VIPDRPERLEGQLEPADHLELRLAHAVALLVVGLGGHWRDQLVGDERLELHRIGARIDRRVDERHRQVDAAVVIDAGLGDDEAWLSGSNPAAGDVNRGHRTPARARARRG
jgi:hypothetical protein